jgi:hypothetical protein
LTCFGSFDGHGPPAAVVAELTRSRGDNSQLGKPVYVLVTYSYLSIKRHVYFHHRLYPYTQQGGRRQRGEYISLCDEASCKVAEIVFRHKTLELTGEVG